VATPGYPLYDLLQQHCQGRRNCIAITDCTKNVDLDKLKNPASGEAGGAAMAMPPRDKNCAFYAPWIVMRNPMPKATGLIDAPPSGAMAGIFARVDATRGIHKAPANEPIVGALDVTVRITDWDQGPLNRVGINCIRYFTGEGVIAWGARTRDKSGEWRYINVRRLFGMIEESIVRSMRWVVFEPNTPTLWKSIRRDVSAFLTRLWRDGALMGDSPEEAFFVKCDEETNPQDEIDAGRVITEVGIAPVKPAEFVWFKISQSTSGAQVESE